MWSRHAPAHGKCGCDQASARGAGAARCDFAADRGSRDRGLDHPNVIVVLDQGVREDGRAWLAMELADADLLRLAPRNWTEAREALIEILRGLAHIHARGLVHRDLKPVNVLSVAGTWKIADLGIAHAVHGERTSARSAGSPAYMAPEQLKGDLASQGPATDLYAVGCLAWELVHGTPPFPRATVKAMARACTCTSRCHRSAPRVCRTRSRDGSGTCWASVWRSAPRWLPTPCGRWSRCRRRSKAAGRSGACPPRPRPGSPCTKRRRCRICPSPSPSRSNR